MKVELKLYATLSRYLPAEAVNHAVKLEVPEGTTPDQVMERQALPKESCFLVVVNGLFVPPEERTTRQLKDGDTMAIWPPVAGG